MLEPKNNCRRVSFTWFCRLFCILCFNLYFIPVQINEESATPFIATYTYSTIPGGFVFLWTIASLHSLCYKLIMKDYANDLMFFWRAMLPSEKRKLSKFIKMFALLCVMIVMIVAVNNVLQAIGSASVFPQWYHYYLSPEQELLSFHLSP